MSKSPEDSPLSEQAPQLPAGSSAETESVASTGAESKSSPRITKPALPRNVSLPMDPPDRPALSSGRHWGRRLWASNPFYPVSAALILYGCYRLSVDTALLRGETPQMIFSFSSLQVYEVLLVLTAVFLAARRILYDSNLLVAIENLMVLAPFVLISHAALIYQFNQVTVWGLSFLVGLLAVGRWVVLKRGINVVAFPARVLGVGGVILAVNTALPIVYRCLHQNKVGTRLAQGAAFEINEFAWLVVLPLLAALVDFPGISRQGGQDARAPRWLPPGLWAAWFAGTALHLYCLGYIYDFDLRPELLAPALWVLCWSARPRLRDLGSTLSPRGQAAFLGLPFLAVFLARHEGGSKVFVALTLLNFMLYGRSWLRGADGRLALHLALLSLAFLPVGLPLGWDRTWSTNFDRAAWAGGALAVYALIALAYSRDPKHAVLGALIAGVTTRVLANGRPDVEHWAMQAALIYLLGHSLRWADADHTGARLLRWFAGAFLVVISFVWLNSGGAMWMACASAALALAACLAARLADGVWGPYTPAVCAVLVAMTGPLDLAASHLRSAPAGVVAVAGSFALFAAGTLAALSKSKLQVEHR